MHLTGISQGIFDQGTLFIVGVILGVVLWFLYDWLRLWRRLVFHGKIWIAIEDMVFFVAWAVVGFQLVYPLNLGQTRIYLLLAVGIGSVIYLRFVSPHLIRGGTWVIRKIKGMFGSRVKRRKKNGQKPINTH